MPFFTHLLSYSSCTIDLGSPPQTDFATTVGFPLNLLEQRDIRRVLSPRGTYVTCATGPSLCFHLLYVKTPLKNTDIVAGSEGCESNLTQFYGPNMRVISSLI
jgi:hypothetical protein